ncbi:MAG: hypothetical protein ACLU37_01135 [Collinsella sp.]
MTEQLRNTRFPPCAPRTRCATALPRPLAVAPTSMPPIPTSTYRSLRQRRASMSLDLSGDPLFKRLPPARLALARARTCYAPTTPHWCWRRSAGPRCASAS